MELPADLVVKKLCQKFMIVIIIYLGSLGCYVDHNDQLHKWNIVLSQLQEYYRKLQKSHTITKIQEPATPENHPRIISADNSKTLQKYSPAPALLIAPSGHPTFHVSSAPEILYVSDAF